MTSLQGAIKWSHESLCSDKILKFILMKEIVVGSVLYTYKFPIEAPLIQ